MVPMPVPMPVPVAAPVGPKGLPRVTAKPGMGSKFTDKDTEIALINSEKTAEEEAKKRTHAFLGQEPPWQREWYQKQRAPEAPPVLASVMDHMLTATTEPGITTESNRLVELVKTYVQDASSFPLRIMDGDDSRRDWKMSVQYFRTGPAPGQRIFVSPAVLAVLQKQYASTSPSSAVRHPRQIPLPSQQAQVTVSNCSPPQEVAAEFRPDNGQANGQPLPQGWSGTALVSWTDPAGDGVRLALHCINH